MNILWIDDFSCATTNHARVSMANVFGDFTKEILGKLDKLAQSDEDDPKFLHDLLKKNSNPIYWYDGLVTGLDSIVRGESFDFFILDSDLPIDENIIDSDLLRSEKETKNIIDNFRKNGTFPDNSLQAGFTIYFFLIESGFPPGIIVFLSANANKSKEIEESFTKAKATPLEYLIRPMILILKILLRLWKSTL